MDNRFFWNNRYIDHPWLGSGPGSRGIAQHYKASVLKKVLTNNTVSSIIDIGCGDMSWLKTSQLVLSDLENLTYLGLDISETIINNNREVFPSLNFDVFDLEASPLPGPADLIICMDVLIHQTNRTQFDACLLNLLRGINKHALISYKNPDQSNTPIVPEIAQFDEIHESSFRKMADAKKEEMDIARAETANFGSLMEWPLISELSLQSKHIGDYRFQSLYELTRSEWMDIF